MTRGRPRSEESRRAVLSAALGLCERDGYQAVTLKDIAAAAGVGRQTLYRWWGEKAEILLEALGELAAEGLAAPEPSGDPAADLEEFLVRTFGSAGTYVGAVVVGVMVDGQGRPELGERVRRELIQPRRGELRPLLDRVLPPEVDRELAVDLVFGAMWYRLLNRHAPVDGAFAREVAAAVLRMAG
ncbi:TetR/AcrR family transcriptional regulator [Actinocorallia longicatena]|uniref:TetR/AcrR family transcriptional regulator n=1 Tax=Actinocorallia longicatena TaxID=111803 RepID=A0ABP6QQZ0_9ACTN